MWGDLSWMDGMRQLLGRTDVDFTDFKAFTAEYLNRYICQFKNAYFERCSGVSDFVQDHVMTSNRGKALKCLTADMSNKPFIMQVYMGNHGAIPIIQVLCTSIPWFIGWHWGDGSQVSNWISWCFICPTNHEKLHLHVYPRVCVFVFFVYPPIH